MRIPMLLSIACIGAPLLQGCGPAGSGSRPAPTPGARLYMANCLACHQADGSGVRGLQPPLAGTPVAIGDPRPLLAWVMYGTRPAALPRGVYSGVMPQFSYLSDADLATLLSYVRSSFGNQSGPVSADTVAEARAAHAGR